MTGKLLSKSVNRWWLWALVAISALLFVDALLNLLAEQYWFQELKLPGGVLAAVAIAAPPGASSPFFF